MIINRTDDSQVINDLSDIQKFNYAVSTQIINPKTVDNTNLLVYPNPSVNQVNISYELYEDSDIRISILDINGRYLTKFIDEGQVKGQHHLTWNFNLENGTYFIHFQTENQTKVKKLIILN